MLGKVILSAAALTLLSGAVAAEDKKVSKFDKVMANYERSGELKHCVRASSLRESRVLDETHIFFRVSPRKAYLNTLPRKCRTLKFNQAISYAIRGGQLCSNEVFTVLDSNLNQFGVCSFGKWEKIVKKPRAERGLDKDKSAAEEWAYKDFLEMTTMARGQLSREV